MSSQICSHILVAAEINGELKMFLQWYTSNDLQPNVTQLGMAGLPRGRGRKGGIPKRKRLRTPAASPTVVVPRSATQLVPRSAAQHTTGWLFLITWWHSVIF